MASSKTTKKDLPGASWLETASMLQSEDGNCKVDGRYRAGSLMKSMYYLRHSHIDKSVAGSAFGKSLIYTEAKDIGVKQSLSKFAMKEIFSQNLS